MRRRGLNTPPGGQLRVRPDFPASPDLQANAGPAAREAFKRATDARSAWLACSAAFCVAILDGIQAIASSMDSVVLVRFVL